MTIQNLRSASPYTSLFPSPPLFLFGSDFHCCLDSWIFCRPWLWTCDFAPEKCCCFISLPHSFFSPLRPLRFLPACCQSWPAQKNRGLVIFNSDHDGILLWDGRERERWSWWSWEVKRQPETFMMIRQGQMYFLSFVMDMHLDICSVTPSSPPPLALLLFLLHPGHHPPFLHPSILHPCSY